MSQSAYESNPDAAPGWSAEERAAYARRLATDPSPGERAAYARRRAAEQSGVSRDDYDAALMGGSRVDSSARAEAERLLGRGAVGHWANVYTYPSAPPQSAAAARKTPWRRGA